MPTLGGHKIVWLRISNVILLVRAVVLFVALTASTRTFAAAVLEPGDLILSHILACTCGFTDAKINVFTNTGLPKLEVFAGGRDVLVSPDGVVFAIDYWTFKVSAYSASLEPLRTIGTDAFATALAMDNDQNLYLINNVEIRRYTTAGVLLSSQPFPSSDGPLISADLGTDQCTLYYYIQSESRRSIRRYDLCGRRELPDMGLTFPSTPVADIASVRVAPDGSVFVATLGSIYQSFGGGARRTYTPPANEIPLAIAPGADARTVWYAGRSLSSVDWQSQSLTAGPFYLPGNSAPAALAIYGVPRASASATVAQIPVMSTSALISLVFMLTVVACVAINRGGAA